MKATLIIAAAIILSPSITSAQKVKADYDKTISFSGYRTYSWREGLPARNGLIDQMIVDEINRELARKGLSKVASDGDVQVSYYAAAGYDLQVAQPDWTPSQGSLNAGFALRGQMWNVFKGTLVVDLTDGKSDRRVWRGVATDTFSDSRSGNPITDAKRVEKQVRRAAQKLIKKVPVSSKS